MDMLNRLPKFDGLATKTANCLLGFECNTESNVRSQIQQNPSTVVAGQQINKSNANQANADQAKANANTQDFIDHTKKVKNEITSALEAMAAKNKQAQMNSMSKGPYFLIFMIALLLMGFSLGKDEEED